MVKANRTKKGSKSNVEDVVSGLKDEQSVARFDNLQDRISSLERELGDTKRHVEEIGRMLRNLIAELGNKNITEPTSGSRRSTLAILGELGATPVDPRRRPKERS